MANILVLGVRVPFTKGGAETLVSTLIAQLRARGHEADTVELPFTTMPKESLLTQAAMWRSLDLSKYGDKKVDLVIATKFPSYYAKATRKSVWLVHQHRPIYDLYGTRFCDFSDDPRDEELRRMLVDGDSTTLGEAQYVSGISKNVIQRLKHFNGITGEPLYPPLPLGTRYHSEPSQNYILSVGRLCNIKRVDLIIKALPTINPALRLKVIGMPDEPGVMDYYQNLIKAHDLSRRVDFLGRVSDEQLVELYAQAFGVFYAPYNEDYGYVTLEAFASRKPVVTAHDSGGVLEFVQHQHNALVVDPTPDAMAEAFNRLYQDRALGESLGNNGFAGISELGLFEGGWDRVVERLLSPLRGA